MSTALQLTPRTIVSTQELMENGYMTIEQSKSLIIKKINKYYQKK